MTVSIFTIHSIALVKYLREVKYRRGNQVFIRPSGAVQSSVACTMIGSYHNIGYQKKAFYSMITFVDAIKIIDGEDESC